MEKIYTIKEIAELLKVNKMTIYRYIKAGRLPAIYLGKEYRVLESDLIAFLHRHRVKEKTSDVL